MGQYYNVYTERNGKVITYDRTLNHKYTMAKLMEHSWWHNPFVNTICHKIHNKPTTIAWVGDYADEFEHYSECWGDKANNKGLMEAQVVLWDKYLVNHSKKEFIDCNKYYDKSINCNWCIHPLPILTAVGNGRGGGDYSGTCIEYVGRWAMDKISVSDERPKDYLEVTIGFKESR